MEHLSNVLKALFACQDGDEILRKAGILKGSVGRSDRNSKIEYLHKETSESILMSLLQRVNIYNTMDQKSIIVQVFHSKWSQPDYSVQSLRFTRDATVFNGLLHFALGTLTVKDHDPICRYHRLLRWHSLSSLLGEDIFTTSYLASRDLAVDQRRNFFGWDAVIGHDNAELNALLSRPIADVHMHLKGSSFNFDLSWISIMNNFMLMQHVFDNLNEEYKDSSDWDQNIYSKIRRAAAIRVYLASAVGLLDDSLSTAELDIILNSDMAGIATTGDVSEKVFGARVIRSCDYKSVQDIIDNRNRYLIDTYGDKLAIRNEYISDVKKVGAKIKYRSSEVLSSERRLLYHCFLKLFSANEDISIFATIFYAYLSYKAAFRQQVLQLNEQIGFKNFSKFEARKI